MRQANAAAVTYQLVVNNTWSEATHPGAYPPDGHFSFLGGATHNAGVSFWSEGAVATPGIVYMAETGGIDRLQPEVQAAIDTGTANQFLGWEHWFCPAALSSAPCGSTVVEFEVDSDFPLVTLASMLGPTPDWFVGVDSLPLFAAGDWLDEVTVDLFPYDGGTLDGTEFALFNGNRLDPALPISLISDESGQPIGPASLGTFTFTRTPSPVPLPAALSMFLMALGAFGAWIYKGHLRPLAIR